LYCGDSRDITPQLPDNSVDLFVEDWPYYRVKGEWWDRQWNDVDAFLAWVGELLEERRRLLKPNGSLYVFASPQMAARVECKVREHFNVLNRIVWAKPAFSTEAEMFRKDDMRSYFPVTEYIFFAEHYGADNAAKGEAGYTAQCDQLRGFVFEPLRAYLAGEWERADLSFEDARQAVGCASGSGLPSHWFTRSQWLLPTEERYHQLRVYANAHNHGGEYLRREYEHLRREYEDLRRPFLATPERPYTDVWDFPTVQSYPGKHPCEKPVEMMEHIILTSSRPGATVVDFFMGHGTTALAAQKHGREFIGGDIMQSWVEATEKRLRRAQHQATQLSFAGEVMTNG
jgi:site-specific DNA-methyltransferase (adenine-specific)